MTPTDQLLSELARMLRGSRQARRRLLDEIREDLHDAVAAERQAGLDRRAAEQAVADRFGSPRTLATRWNRDRAERSVAVRRNVVLILVAVVSAGSLAMTQYASGKNAPPRSSCARAGVKTTATENSGYPRHPPLHAAIRGPHSCSTSLRRDDN